MRIWAIGDLHLSFGIANKSMDIFGPAWKDHADAIAFHWKSLIHPEDLVLIPGDISWAMRLEDAEVDLRWIDHLPGTKVMIKGNHDYWWGSLKQISKVLPPSIHLIQNNAFLWNGVAIGGARLWDTPEYGFNEFIAFQENPKQKSKPKTSDAEDIVQEELSQKIFNRELERLSLSLQAMDQNSSIRIAMTHYPPIGADMKPSRASQILERYNVQICVFGHLHNIHENTRLFGTSNGISYLLTSSDYLGFQPVLVLDTESK